MSIPDMTQRFPEGMRGVDMTDKFFTPSGIIEEDVDFVTADQARQMEEDAYEYEVFEISESYEIDTKTAEKIVGLQRANRKKIQEIKLKEETDISDILEENGYERLDGVPF